MTQETKKPAPTDAYQAWQKYFEDQQKIVLTYWTAVLNSMWGTSK
jgi:hypothetical protein